MGAVVEAFDRLHGQTRAGLLHRRSWAAPPSWRRARRSASAEEHEDPRDISILNLMLTLEQLQAVFYTETERNHVLHGAPADQASVVGSHERAHALGGGRHAAWIRRLAGQPPVSGRFDEPVSRATTTRIVDRTHFVARTTSRRGPRFTG